jgi:uncharacterized Ntn-hydrolase superfamily protein
MTFSIIARDPGNGRFAIAVATFHIAVGATVPHLRRDVGAVATQAATNPYLGIRSLEALKAGLSAAESLQVVLGDDDQRNQRQIHLIDQCGRTAAWTGPACNGYSGHHCFEGMSVAGNWLANPDVLMSMSSAFHASDPSWKIGRRVLAALAAGEKCGGDARSAHSSSATLQVSGEQDFTLLDLRVDFHDNAVDELQRIYHQSQAHWAQSWRDQFSDLPKVSKLRRNDSDKNHNSAGAA